EDRRAPLAASLGDFLRVLHRPEVADELGAGLPVDPMRRALPVRRAAMALERLGRVRSRGTFPGDDRVQRLFDASADLGPSRATPVLVHGDLHLRHVLVDDAGAAAGVIDWGDMCLADASVDLSLAYAAFSGKARDGLLAAYGREVPLEQEMRARVLAVSLCAALADYADLDGRPGLLAESLAGLTRAIS
ncbi:MAG: phosphotransferase, partial [Actinomycetes bacterium]